jgi:hypothetical protein
MTGGAPRALPCSINGSGSYCTSVGNGNPLILNALKAPLVDALEGNKAGGRRRATVSKDVVIYFGLLNERAEQTRL